MSRRNKPLAFFVLVVALLFGSFQEKVKISVNNIIKYSGSISNYDSLAPQQRKENVAIIIANIPRGFYSHQNSISWFYNLEIAQLSKLKWVNTLIFTLIHFILNALILHFLFQNNSLIQILVFSYIILFLVSVGVYSIGKIAGLAQPGYNVARKIVGALQSQVPVMIFVIGYYLNKKTIT